MYNTLWFPFVHVHASGSVPQYAPISHPRLHLHLPRPTMTIVSIIVLRMGNAFHEYSSVGENSISLSERVCVLAKFDANRERSEL